MLGQMKKVKSVKTKWKKTHFSSKPLRKLPEMLQLFGISFLARIPQLLCPSAMQMTV